MHFYKEFKTGISAACAGISDWLWNDAVQFIWLRKCFSRSMQ
uniref:Uncharacterized protein n=1 Tax=Anguilla anguilla TaxID=7936 RepID=A0A0E9VM37_ANGAN